MADGSCGWRCYSCKTIPGAMQSTLLSLSILKSRNMCCTSADIPEPLEIVSTLRRSTRSTTEQSFRRMTTKMTIRLTTIVQSGTDVAGGLTTATGSGLTCLTTQTSSVTLPSTKTGCCSKKAE